MSDLKFLDLEQDIISKCLKKVCSSDSLSDIDFYLKDIYLRLRHIYLKKVSLLYNVPYSQLINVIADYRKELNYDNL